MTDETDNPARPNANYKLSKSDSEGAIGEEQLTFYYNRERRLAKAPQGVRDLYEKKRPGFNLLRPLIADKPRALVFMTIIILLVLLVMLSLLRYIDRSYALDGNKLEVSATGFEGTAIVVIKKTAQNDRAYTGEVNIAVSPVIREEGEYPVFYHRVFFTLEPKEEYRFAAPFDDPELVTVLQTEKNTLRLTIKVD